MSKNPSETTNAPIQNDAVKTLSDDELSDVAGGAGKPQIQPASVTQNQSPNTPNQLPEAHDNDLHFFS